MLGRRVLRHTAHKRKHTAYSVAPDGMRNQDNTSCQVYRSHGPNKPDGAVPQLAPGWGLVGSTRVGLAACSNHKVQHGLEAMLVMCQLTRSGCAREHPTPMPEFADGPVTVSCSTGAAAPAIVQPSSCSTVLMLSSTFW